MSTMSTPHSAHPTTRSITFAPTQTSTPQNHHPAPTHTNANRSEAILQGGGIVDKVQKQWDIFGPSLTPLPAPAAGFAMGPRLYPGGASFLQ